VLLFTDYEKVISHYIQYDNYKSALDILTKQVHMYFTSVLFCSSCDKCYNFFIIGQKAYSTILKCI